jgi:hypothetical protein
MNSGEWPALSALAKLVDGRDGEHGEHHEHHALQPARMAGRLGSRNGHAIPFPCAIACLPKVSAVSGERHAQKQEPTACRVNPFSRDML